MGGQCVALCCILLPWFCLVFLFACPLLVVGLLYSIPCTSHPALHNTQVTKAGQRYLL